MKNNKIFFLNTLIIIITSILIITNYLRDRIPKNIFDNLMIIYGILYVCMYTYRCNYTFCN